MLVDFDKIFSEPELQDTMPDGFIESLNSTAPPDTHYERIDRDRCVLKCDDGKSMTLGGLLFEPTEEQKQILGENFTQEEFLTYLYNSQTKYRFSLAVPGEVVINGERKSVDQLDVSLHNSVSFADDYVYLHPAKMDMAFDMRVSVGTIEQTFHMVRKSNNSIYEMLFESDETHALKIQIKADIRENINTMDYTVKIGRSDTVREMLEAAKLYNAFVSGDICIDGKKIDISKGAEDSKVIDESDIFFWEKVYEIEKALDAHFVLPERDISMKDARSVELLYQSLIKKNPTKYGKRVNSLTGRGFHGEEDIEKKKGEPLFIEFSRKEEIDLFGEHLDLLGFISICNAILNDYTVEGESVTLEFADKSEEEKMFTTIILFIDDEEFEKYQKEDVAERERRLHSAKELGEYM